MTERADLDPPKLDAQSSPSSSESAPPSAGKQPPSNLAMRVLSALVAAPLILALLYLGPNWAWLAFITAAAVVGSYELYGMLHPDDRLSQTIAVLETIGVLLVLWHYGMDAKILVAMMLALPILSQLVVLARLGDMRTAALRLSSLSFGPLYVGAGMATLALLKRDAGSDGPGFVVLALMLSWLSDTGAYFAGRFLGKNKLYAAVSPKKTVEGAIGGIEVAAQQVGRGVQLFGMVVESVGRGVRWEQVGEVHLDPEKVAHGVGVLGPVEAAHHHPALRGPGRPLGFGGPRADPLH